MGMTTARTCKSIEENITRIMDLESITPIRKARNSKKMETRELIQINFQFSIFLVSTPEGPS